MAIVVAFIQIFRLLLLFLRIVSERVCVIHLMRMCIRICCTDVYHSVIWLLLFSTASLFIIHCRQYYMPTVWKEGKTYVLSMQQQIDAVWYFYAVCRKLFHVFFFETSSIHPKQIIHATIYSCLLTKSNTEVHEKKKYGPSWTIDKLLNWLTSSLNNFYDLFSCANQSNAKVSSIVFSVGNQLARARKRIWYDVENFI